MSSLREFPEGVLASTSPRRAELLRQVGWRFRIVPSNAPEVIYEEMTAVELARINAYRKARWVAKKHPDSLVLGADTLVYIDSALFGKPATLEEAYSMLEQLQGRTHRVVTGVCLMHLRERRERVFTEVTAVKFRPLDAVGIQRYLVQVNPLDKAGAYAIQEHGELIIEGIDGSFSNVVGLPLERLQAEFAEWNAPLPPVDPAIVATIAQQPYLPSTQDRPRA
jgi:septum formation protein